MAISASEKKRLKRKEARKAGLRKREELLERERYWEYEELVHEAFADQAYEDALYWAEKCLRIDPKDQIIRRIAIQAAKFSNNGTALYRFLGQEWTDGTLHRRDDALILGKLAVARKDFGFARKVFDAVLHGKTPFGGRSTKTIIKQAHKGLDYADIMERAWTLELESRASGASRHKVNKERGQVSRPTGPVAHQGQPQEAKAPPQEELPELAVEFETDPGPVLRAIEKHRVSSPEAYELALQAYRHSFRASYDQLICLPTLRGVESLWYQEETARKVMRTFRGRAILADEVGLGKTIEAGLVLKEYLLRGLIRSALVLAPSSLVKQWQEELLEKFDLAFVSSHDALFRQDPERFWAEPFIVASLHTARSQRHFQAVTSHSYDMVIVDEAHHLKNQTTRSWKLVNAIEKTFLLLLTATPVQNNLEELYNLVTILRPGHLKTRKAFADEFVSRGNPTDPRNREKLRELLKEVMIRNTRSVTQLRLPPRFAVTTRVSPSYVEEDFYAGISRLVSLCAAGKTSGVSHIGLRKLLEAAGSSHYAAMGMLERLKEHLSDGNKTLAHDLLEMGARIGMGSKTAQVMDLLGSVPHQKILFVNYVATLEHLRKVLTRQHIPHVVYQGGLTPAQKQASIEQFRAGCPVLLGTGIGGEGHNLQFCHVMINFDLPWNPMEIEQRIGRIHRIGQEKEVQIYNFCQSGSIEDHILNVLDRKINMFELVVGEVDMILGRLQDEKDFAEMVFEIWTHNAGDRERQEAFDALGTRLKRARNAYEKSKELDEKLFQEDFGI